VELQPRIKPDWHGEPVLVIASGPSLTAQVSRQCRLARWLDGWKVLAVNDAYKAVPWADALYAADKAWWQVHRGADDFEGERFTSHCPGSLEFCDDKTELVKQFSGLTLINARSGKDFSNNPEYIHYGEQAHSGFQAVNLALLKGAARVVLVGFDYRFIEGKSHFFGDHSNGLAQFEESKFRLLADAFKTAPSDRVVNTTPGSRLTAYPQVTLDEALQRHDRLHWDRPIADASTD
jgi:hypothetical protein